MLYNLIFIFIYLFTSPLLSWTVGCLRRTQNIMCHIIRLPFNQSGFQPPSTAGTLHYVREQESNCEAWCRNTLGCLCLLHTPLIFTIWTSALWGHSSLQDQLMMDRSVCVLNEYISRRIFQFFLYMILHVRLSSLCYCLFNTPKITEWTLYTVRKCLQKFYL